MVRRAGLVVTLMAIALIVPVGSALAQHAESAAAGAPQAQGANPLFLGLIALASGLGIGLGAFGGALGQSKAAVAALEGIARNPGARGAMFTPLILALVLIETLVIYTLIVTFLLQQKIPAIETLSKLLGA